MRDFWDARAQEDAYFFVDDRQPYGAPDTESFWADGQSLLDYYAEHLGAHIEPGDTVVEIGCGIGRLTRPIAARAAHVHALDVSARMLDRARTEHPDLDNVDWVQGSGSDLQPVGDAGAHACLSHVVFQHIPDPRITLSYVTEMGRVLRSGGWSAFQVSNAPSIHRPRGSGPLAAARRLLRRGSGGPRGQHHPAWLGSAVDLDELRQTAAAAGLDVERVEGAGTQFCLVMLRRVQPEVPSAGASA